jgi:O-antigen ligase
MIMVRIAVRAGWSRLIAWGRARGSALPAVIFVVGYAGLRLCIPSQLVLRPLGAAGSPASLWGICALVWWVVTTVGGKNPVRGLTGIRLGFGALTLAVLTAYAAGNLTGWYAPPSIRQATDEFWTLLPATVLEITDTMISAADRGLMSFAGWLGILLITADGLRSRNDLERLTTWLVRFGAFVALLGIVQYFTEIDIAGLFRIPGLSANSEFGEVVSRSVVNRVSSTATHPIELGVAMAALFPLALHHSLHARGDGRSLRAWIPTALIGAVIPMSVSRSGILVAGVACLVLFLGWPRGWRVRALIVLPFAAVAMRLLAPGLLGTIRSLFANLDADPSVSGRTDDYAVVLQLYAENAIFGRGLFTFVPRYYRILDNQLLMILIELGVVGLIVTVFAVGTAFFGALGARRRTRDPLLRHLCLAIAASISGLVASYATFDAWGFPITAGLSFLLFGMAGCAVNLARREERDSIRARTEHDVIMEDRPVGARS